MQFNYAPHLLWKKSRATAALAIAQQIYVEEWESLSPLMRPQTPNLSADRAYRDGFITSEQYHIYLQA
jgi:hypothetical protein